MKTKPIARLSLLLGGVLALVPVQSTSAQTRSKAKQAIKPRPTHAQVVGLRKDVQSDGKIELAEDPQPLKEAQSGKTDSLIKRSAIISHGGQWTLVPKESVLYVPKHLASRVNGERKGKLVLWKAFLTKNRSWLQLQNVKIEHARGEAVLSEGLVKAYRSSGRIVIATCHGGPISVKPPKSTAVAVDAKKKKSALK